MMTQLAHAWRLARRLLAGVALAAAATAAAACGDDPFEPSSDDVVGLYETTAFYIVDSGDTLDLAEAGADVTLALEEDGTTSGEFFMPWWLAEGTDVRENLAGTWDLSGSSVLLDHAADTFLNDFALRVRAPGRLELRATDDGAVLFLRLERVE